MMLLWTKLCVQNGRSLSFISSDRTCDANRCLHSATFQHKNETCHVTSGPHLHQSEFSESVKTVTRKLGKGMEKRGAGDNS